jgi:hypothetical protein
MVPIVSFQLLHQPEVVLAVLAVALTGTMVVQVVAVLEQLAQEQVAQVIHHLHLHRKEQMAVLVRLAHLILLEAAVVALQAQVVFQQRID